MSKELEKAVKHVFDRAKEMGDMYEYEYPYITKKLKEDIALVEQALKLNEPMKVKLKTHLQDISNGETIGLCPNCNCFVKDIYKRCPDCGKILDWSDEK